MISAGARPVLATLQKACGGKNGEGAHLGPIQDLVADGLVDVDETLNELRSRRDPVSKSAIHLLALPGKRLRPLCVAIAAGLGEGFTWQARQLATAVELVHSATLLHDDVVDLGTSRRGQPTARLVFGNAASIFAGDLLLVEALRRVSVAGIDGVMEGLLGVIAEMIEAEAIQLEARGRVISDRATYFRVVRGKTASLFRFAFFAGARAGGIGGSALPALERFGEELGIAFQIVDDVLDLSGDEELTGKALFADLAEGKMTFPSIVGMERDPSLLPLLEAAALGSDRVRAAEILAALAASGAIAEAMRTAEEHVARAVRELGALPPSELRSVLELVARATTDRRR
jgi:octaprenyl-diphosphate synthase